MTNFFKSRFFAVILVLALILCILPTTLSVMGQGDYVRSAVMVIVSPFQKLGTFCADSLRGFSDYFHSYRALWEENEQLKDSLAEAQEKLYEASLREEENDWLRSYLELKKLHYDYSFADAKVIGRETVNTRDLYILNRGSASGIEKGMPVITQDGLLGYIIEVELTRSKAAVISAERSSVGVCDERSGALGVMSGSYELSLDGLCRITVADADADIRVGDRIVTSGLGGVYPEGLYVGVVTDVQSDPYDRMPRATVRPAADFSSATDVMIVTGFSLSESGAQAGAAE